MSKGASSGEFPSSDTVRRGENIFFAAVSGFHMPRRIQRSVDRTADVRTQPILSPVQARHSARGRSPTVGWTSHLPCAACSRALRLILRKTLPTRIPTRSLPSTGGHSANAAPWLESVPHNLDACRSLFMHTAGAPLNGPAQVTGIHFVPSQPRRLTQSSFQSP